MQHDSIELAAPAPVKLQFQASPLAVRDALSSARDGWANAQLSRDLCEKAEQVLAEVLNNVVEHAHQEKLLGIIRVETQITDRGLVCEITDDGRPMPNGQTPLGELADLSDALDDLPEGGFGWFMINALTTELTYCRKDNWNHLHFLVAEN